MMPGHGVNPIFFHDKNKDWTSRILANLRPPTSSNISFLRYLSNPVKVDAICVLLLIINHSPFEFLPDINFNSKIAQNEHSDFILQEV